MAYSTTRSEFYQLAVLLIAVAAFYFLIIPTGIVDPNGMSIDQGLPPSFSAKLVAALAGGLMVIRCVQLVCFRPSVAPDTAAGADEASEIAADDDPQPEGWPVRGLLSMAAGLVFAYALVPLIGFFPAGFLLLVVLLKILGETRPLSLIVPPVIVSAMVWLLFEQLLSIRLPDGSLFSG